MRLLTFSIKHVHARRRSVGRLTLALLALVLLTLGSSVVANTPAPAPSALEGVDAVEAIELANAWKGSDVTSFATTEEVFFAFPDGTEVSIPMPEEQVFISVAPYLQRTHPCTTHYMSGCQGELVDQPIQVRAVRPDGSVVLDEVMNTGRNGFLDLWLPRGEAFLLQVSIDGYGTQAIIGTNSGNPTCITTMQMTPGGS